MKAGRDLDALIAEKVMGWPKNSVVWYIDDKPFRISDFSPSTQIADAWLVVEKFAGAEKSIGESGGVELLDRWQIQLQWDHNWMWDATLSHLVGTNSVSEDVTEFFAQAPAAPLAICLSALKAVGVNIDDEV